MASSSTSTEPIVIGSRVDAQQLQQLRETLAADGYLIEVSGQDARARVAITAQEGVCEDCLVPKPLMLSMLAPILGTEPDAIELIYPNDLPDDIE